MKMTRIFSSFLALSSCAIAYSVPSLRDTASNLKPRQSNCSNTATSRICWGAYNIDTNYYEETPSTNVTREYWLSVEQSDCAPDGYPTTCMTFNGTVPGPLITADWGDNLVIHLTNNLKDNGTSIHWHGLRQLNTVHMDGVPGITQCPIAPGESLTYSFRATQYGTSWYHSHLSLQYGEGLFGPLILNGPATADYDEDLGELFLSDWSHTPIFTLWDTAKQGAAPTLESGLINGTNTYNCTDADDGCEGIVGAKYEAVFESGKKYLIRIVNAATEGHFQFSIDGHSLIVIANDLVPIVPYTTESVLVTMGQRYDVIVEANAAPGNYWLRAGWISACAMNLNPDGMTGIVRYDNSSTADPTSSSTVTTTATCGDEPYESLVPHLALDVGRVTNMADEELGFKFDTYFKWTLNDSSLLIDWSLPTLREVLRGADIFPTEYNMVAVDVSGIRSFTYHTAHPKILCFTFRGLTPLLQKKSSLNSTDEWAVLLIQDETGLGLFHPIHLHGHDFWVVAQGTGVFDAAKPNFTTTNPPRRDVASLPGNGYLALAFKLDNPGTWLTHCHIAWHASEGFSLEFVEGESVISASIHSAAQAAIDNTCTTWRAFNQVYPQDDSGV
ncbi:hypothetical protein VMCG_07032 [Cytospora schulzeri]|uniref:Laccase n=1 Tax=Cytospora schulzeri TaxID=448051 RepID=A0A423W421_9PEZI|nr:hypothetical protein VMCG_07032 [Valsa malicola]